MISNMTEERMSHRNHFLSRLLAQSSNLPAFHSARPALLYLGLATLLLGATLLSGCQSYEFKGTLYTDPQPAPDFELTAPNGERFRLSDHQGEIVLMFFGYTSCPDVCPTTLAEARRILEKLGEDGDRVTFLFITVDPERDTPEVLGTYTTAFHPAIVGLTAGAYPGEPTHWPRSIPVTLPVEASTSTVRSPPSWSAGGRNTITKPFAPSSHSTLILFGS